LGVLDAPGVVRADLDLGAGQCSRKEDKTMWTHLLKLYEESLLNAERPECLFKETLIFEEGWLLRSVLKHWKTSSRRSDFPFFRFPSNAKVYSEGQLYTPFKVRPESERTGKRKGETNTRIDGIVGDFSIAEGTKAGIELAPGCEYIAVFEAKLYSPLSRGVKYADHYDQVSRTTACLIHSLLKAGPSRNCRAYVVVLHPEDSPKINEDDYPQSQIEEQIRKRLADYKSAGDCNEELEQFEAGWRGMLDQVKVRFKTWEEVLAEIGDAELGRFYDYCKEFN
jgi:hypothetical protein